MKKLKTENMLHDIETAVFAELKKHLPKLGEFNVGRGLENTLNTPAASVTIEKIDIVEPGSGGMHTLDDNYELQPTISVYVIFKAVQPDPRRKGIYPMIVATAALLLGKNFDLNIEPLESAGPIQEIFNSAISAAGLYCFRLDFKTSFELEFESDEEMVKLIITANEYLYKNENAGHDIINHS